jgi:hypothetical protein
MDLFFLIFHFIYLYRHLLLQIFISKSIRLVLMWISHYHLWNRQKLIIIFMFPLKVSLILFICYYWNLSDLRIHFLFISLIYKYFDSIYFLGKYFWFRIRSCLQFPHLHQNIHHWNCFLCLHRLIKCFL